MRYDNFKAKHQEEIDRSGIEEFATQVGSNLLKSMREHSGAWNEGNIKKIYPPYNPRTKVHYSGINFLTLALSEGGQNDPRWYTPKGIREVGAEPITDDKEYIVHVGKSSFVPVLNNETGEHEVDEYGKFKYIEFESSDTVYTAHELVNGSNLTTVGEYRSPIRSDSFVNAKSYEILSNSGATFKHGGESSHYDPDEDVIYLKEPESYSSAQDYYADGLRQLSKWTGHPSRLDREDAHSPVVMEDFNREELRQQLSHFMTSVKHGVKFTPQEFKDCANAWETVLQEDPIAILSASADAQKINLMLDSFLYEKSQEYVEESPYSIKPISLILDEQGKPLSHSVVAFNEVFPEKDNVLISTDEIRTLDVPAIFEKGGADAQDIDEKVKGNIPAQIEILKAVAEKENLSLDMRYNSVADFFELRLLNNKGGNVGMKMALYDDRGIEPYVFDFKAQKYNALRTNSTLAISQTIKSVSQQYVSELKGTHAALKELENAFSGTVVDQRELWKTNLRSDVDSNPVKTMITTAQLLRANDLTAAITNRPNRINMKVFDDQGFSGMEASIDKKTGQLFMLHENEGVGQTKDARTLSITQVVNPVLSDFINKKIEADKENGMLSVESGYGGSLTAFAELNVKINKHIESLNSQTVNAVYTPDQNVFYSVKEYSQDDKNGFSLYENGKPMGVLIFADDIRAGAMQIHYISAFDKKTTVQYESNGVENAFNSIQNHLVEYKSLAIQKIENVTTGIKNDSQRKEIQSVLIDSLMYRPKGNNMAYATIGANESIKNKKKSEVEIKLDHVKTQNGIENILIVRDKKIPFSQMHIRVHLGGNEELILKGVRSNERVVPDRIQGLATENKAMNRGIAAVDRAEALKAKDISNEITWINVERKDSDKVKAIAGSWWDENVRSWYIKAGYDRTPFAQWRSHDYDPKMSAEEAFAQHLQKHGFIVNASDIKHAYGKDSPMQRCRIDGEGKEKKGRYKFFPADVNASGRAGGIFFKGAQSFSWVDEHNAKPMTPEEKQAQMERNAKRIESTNAIKKEGNKQAQIVSQAIWQEAEKIAHTHRYVEMKQIQNHSALRVVPDSVSDNAKKLGIVIADNAQQAGRLYKQAERDGKQAHVFVKGDLLIPAFDMNGTLKSVQKINTRYNSEENKFESGKFFMKDADTVSRFCTTDGKIPTGKGEIILAEGYATADSVARITGKSVVVAFDAGNLYNVAKAFREKYPDASITVASDNDHVKEREGKGNAGVYYATKVAQDFKAVVVTPRFDPNDRGSDWNDVLLGSSLGETKEMYQSLRRDAIQNFEKTYGAVFSASDEIDHEIEESFER